MKNILSSQRSMRRVHKSALSYENPICILFPSPGARPPISNVKNMLLAAHVAVGIVALLHAYFLVLEMFLWDKPQGLAAFGLTQELATASKTLAMNQGLYNGFLAAGLVWGLLLGTAGRQVEIFFLACVILAGVFGGLTASRKILVVQALPAAIALALVYFAG